jgi:hypothetical protein
MDGHHVVDQLVDVERADHGVRQGVDVAVPVDRQERQEAAVEAAALQQGELVDAGHDRVRFCATPNTKTAVLTITRPGATVLVDRNVHKSVVASLILVGARPVWLHPCWDQHRQIAHPADADTVSAALGHHPDVAAVVMITPTEYGTAPTCAASPSCATNAASR